MPNQSSRWRLTALLIPLAFMTLYPNQSGNAAGMATEISRASILSRRFRREAMNRVLDLRQPQSQNLRHKYLCSGC
jgi:hypothetical protein